MSINTKNQIKKSDEYLLYLDTIQNPCLKKIYKKIYSEVKQKNYAIIKNKLHVYYNKINNEKNIYYLGAFMFLLSNFMSYDMIFPILQKLKTPISDKDIFEYIDALNEKQKKRNSTSIDNLCNKYNFSFELIKQEVYKKSKIFNTYLDVCCGDGTKTNIFGKTFNIKNIYGTDIALWGPYSNKKKFPFDFKLIKEGELNYDDNTFDIITCFLSLHHIQDLELMLKSIYNKLKKGGIFVIIEHDVLNYMDNMIVDIQHMFYGYFYDKNKNYIDNPLYGKYYNRMEWSFMLRKVGFKLIHMDNVYENVSMTKRYDNQFYGIFMK